MARIPKALVFDPPYESELHGVLSFRTFVDAERTLLKLEELRQKYLASGDDKGHEYCRQIALLGRRRAELVGRNRNVSEVKRKRKMEIAAWFRIWLETPDLWQDWLELRKASQSYVELLESEGKS
jgi:hypothetical protein